MVISLKKTKIVLSEKHFWWKCSKFYADNEYAEYFSPMLKLFLLEITLMCTKLTVSCLH